MDTDKPEGSEAPVDQNQPAAQPQDDLVDVHEASIEDLDSALANAEKAELGEAPAQPDGSSQPENPASDTVQPAGSPADGSKPSPDVAAQNGTSPNPSQGATQEDNVQAERLRQKELFIQHRGNELGALRAENARIKQDLAAVRAQLANGLDDRAAENPVQAMNDRDKIKEIDNQLQALDAREVRAQKIVEAQTFFLRHVDTEKVSVDDIADTLKADGIDDRYIAQFKSNPWEFTTPEALVQMGKRAQDRKNYISADRDRHLLAKHVLYLNGKLEELKAKPKQIINQVQRRLNQTPVVTSASPASPKTVRDLDPTRMSDAELNAALKSAMH